MINLNGNIIDGSTKIFEVDNRGFKYGDALFETLKVIDQKVQFLEDHYFRLMASMRMLRMEIPMEFTMEYFENQIDQTVEVNELVDARVRFSVVRGDGGLYMPSTNKVAFVIEAKELVISIKESCEIDLFKDYYVHSGLLSTIKTTNKITNVLASIYADENKFDNCVLLNEKKQVVEVINGNIFLVFGTTVKTPSISDGCVKGIIRKKIIETLSRTEKFTVIEGGISPFDLQKADEVFITNSIVGIQSVSKYRKKIYKKEITSEVSILLGQLI